MKTLLAFIVGMVLVSGAFSQNNQSVPKSTPDLSGVWIFDEGKSTADMFPAHSEARLKITYRDPQLKIIRTLKQTDNQLAMLGGPQLKAEFLYYTDGRGETNRSTFGPTATLDVVKSKSTWQDGRLAVASSFSRKKSGAVIYVSTTETWELSSDGKLLTETTTIRTANDSSTFQHVFNRSQ